MILTGLARLGHDISIRQTANGTPVGNLSLAFNYGMKRDGQQPTQWLEAAIYGDRAEKLAPYLTKGTLISVTLDDPHVETYEKRDGTSGVKLAARVVSLEFAGGKREEGAAPAPAQKQAAKPALPGGIQDMDSDIPF
jgi:single-strand DNA-binding protein